MKKGLLILLASVLLTGCESNETVDDNNVEPELSTVTCVMDDVSYDGYTLDSEYIVNYNGDYVDNVVTTETVTSDSEDILDYMGSTELGANIFRITQTEDILSKGHISTEDKACKTHKEVGQKVRKAIKDIGGTMPEDLPTPKESIKKIEKSFLFNKELSNNI